MGKLLMARLLARVASSWEKTVGEAALLLVNLFIKGNLLTAGLLLSAGEKGRGNGCPALGQLVPCFVQCYQGRDGHWRLGAAETWSSRTR